MGSCVSVAASTPQSPTNDRQQKTVVLTPGGSVGASQSESHHEESAAAAKPNGSSALGDEATKIEPLRPAPHPSPPPQKKPELSVSLRSPPLAPTKSPSPRGTVRRNPIASEFHSVVTVLPQSTTLDRFGEPGGTTQRLHVAAAAHPAATTAPRPAQMEQRDGVLLDCNPSSSIACTTAESTTAAATVITTPASGGDELVQGVSSIVVGAPSSRSTAEDASPAIVLHVSFHDVAARVLDQSLSVHDLKTCLTDGGETGSLANTMHSSSGALTSSSHSNLLLKASSAEQRQPIMTTDVVGEHELDFVSSMLRSGGSCVAWTPLTPTGVNHRSQRATKRQSS